MVQKDGFEFIAIVYPFNKYDAIRIKEGSHPISEYVAYINNHCIEKAEIWTSDLSFLGKCTTLKYLKICPLYTEGKYDFSPLYDLPEIKSLHCISSYDFSNATKWEEVKNIAVVDYANIHGLEELSVFDHTSSKNYSKIETLKSLRIGGYCNKKRDLTGMFCSEKLDTLCLIECKEHSLNGLEITRNLKYLDISYNRLLFDIGALVRVKDTLKTLRIQNCPKIKDFSVLKELDHLELLEITGSNTLENLDFLKGMKNLKTFIFDVNILDGNLMPCLNIPHVCCLRGRKHYNLKDKDLPKGKFVHGNEDIEEWRRLE